MEPGALVPSGALRGRGGSRRPLCRNFARGFCRWGQSCRFSHDRKSAPVCRYFQSGFCSYGERCSYQHILEEPVSVGTHTEPSSVPAAVAWGWGRSHQHLAHPVPSVTNEAVRLPPVEAEEEEKDAENIPCGAISRDSVHTQTQGASGSQPRWRGQDLSSQDTRDAAVQTTTQTDPAEVPAEPGAAVPVSTAMLRARSENVVCGICMDRVYEKPLPEERLFGILPNCSHAYCVGCIRKWRRSRDFQNTVVKACPECRVTSSYYIPHKYWVSDAAEKEKLIQTFKARTGKIRCKFFARNRGRCPFKSDCIYLHEPPAGWLPQRPPQRPRMLLEFGPSDLESSAEEDEELCMIQWAFTLALLELDFGYPSYSQGMFLDSSYSN